MSSHNKYAVLDFETTGFGSMNRVVEVGVVLLDEQLQVEETWDTLIQPEREIPNTFVHKITNEDVVDAPLFSGIAARLATMLAERTMVAHNASFEQRFLRQEFARLGVVWPKYGNWVIDTKELSKKFFGKSKLPEALDTAGILNRRPHAALSDAMATASLLKWLVEQESEIVLNTGALQIFPSGLPKPQKELARSTAIKQEEQRLLMQLVKNLPRFTNPALQSYRDMLCEAIADKELDDEEIAKLHAAARAEEIEDADIHSLHREVIRQIALEAWMDGVVISDELKTLKKVAEQLDVDGSIVDELLEQGSRATRESIQLNTGDRIALTGTMEIPREEWMHRATTAGLIVGQVTKKTKVLVASDLNSRNAKIVTAQQLGIPIVTEPEFAKILSSQTEIDTNAEFDVDFINNDADPQQLHVVFPWFKQAPHHIPTPTCVAQAWTESHPDVALKSISPFLDDSSMVDIDREGARVMREIDDHFPNVLHVSVNKLAEYPGVGKLNLNSIVISAVYAALDASEQPTAASEDVRHLEDGQPSGLSAGVYALEDDLNPDFYAVEAYAAEDSAEREQDKMEAYANQILHEKYKKISLGMGWIALQNDLVPTADTISLPPEVSKHFYEAAKLFQDYPPLRMVFAEATAELIRATEGDERKIAIINQRWVGNETLDDVGECFGITRERVRQLELDLRQNFNENRSFYDAVLAKIERFIGRATRLETLRDRFPNLTEQAVPFDTTYGKLFTAVDGAWVVRDGWVFSPSFEDDFQQLLETEKDEFGVVFKHDIIAKAGINERLLNEYLTRELGQKVIAIKDHLIVDAGSHNSRAVALLSIFGDPMTMKEIQNHLGTMNMRSARNQYASDPRLIKVSGDQWALASWGIPEFRTIVDWIAEQVDEEAAISAEAGEEPQGVSLAFLISQADRLRITEGSIRAYAASDGLQLVNGYVRRSESDNATVIGGPISESNGLYFRDGQWHLLLTLSKDHIRGSGFGAPRGIANHFGLRVGDKIELTSPLGPVQVDTNRLRNLNVSSIRRFLEELGSQAGDRVWLKFGDDHTFNVTAAPPLQPHLAGLARAYNLIGLDIDTDEMQELINYAATSEEVCNLRLTAPINQALGLDPQTPRRRTVALLRHRNQEELANAIQTL